MSRTVRRLAALAMAMLTGGTMALSAAGAAHADPPTPLTAASCTRMARFVSGVVDANYVPVTSSGSTNCTLARGNNSNAVVGLQYNLSICYNRSLDADGNFGSNTEAALRFAQGRMGIAQDGVYGPVTRSKMKMFYVLFEGTALCTVWSEHRWTFSYFQS